MARDMKLDVWLIDQECVGWKHSTLISRLVVDGNRKSSSWFLAIEIVVAIMHQIPNQDV